MAKTKKTSNSNDIIKHLEKTIELIKTAKKGKNSLNGTNSYAKKFLEFHVSADKILDDYKSRLDISENSTKQLLGDLENKISDFYDPKTLDKHRRELLREFIVIYKTKIFPKFTKQSTELPTDKLFPFELIEQTRDYVEKIALQATNCYKHSWYDASAVMIRRLLETLIIECFENHSISEKIKNNDGDFFHLKDLIQKFLDEDGAKWNAGRNVKKSLPLLKSMGDQSAHSRRYNARKPDIDNMKNELRLVIEELVSIADLKRS